MRTARFQQWLTMVRQISVVTKLIPAFQTSRKLPHPSSMRTRAADRLYLGTWDAAPKEGAVNTATSRARARSNAIRPWGSCAWPD